MKQRPSFEQAPGINFLSERTKISFSIEKEAVMHLPQITENDLETGKEQFAVLLGSFSKTDVDKVHFEIKGIYQEDAEDKNLGRGTYHEGVEEVEVDIPAIKSAIRSIQEGNPEYKDFHFIGHVHTHPSLPTEAGQSAAFPSSGDMEAFKDNYEQRELTENEPFIFAIAAPDYTGETQYIFYRLIKDGDTYTYRALD